MSWGEASRFAGLQLDTSRLPHSEAVLSIRDWHAATSPWNPDPGTLHSAQTLRSLIAATEEDRVRVYEQRRPSVRGAPLEPTDHTDLLVADASRSVSHWVEVRLTGESDEARAGERYRVLLGDNTEIEGELDVQGVARIPGLPPGPCQWFFPSLEPGEWTRA